MSKSGFNQQFSFLQSSIFWFTYIFIIVISYSIFPGTFRYIGICHILKKRKKNDFFKKSKKK